MRASGLNLWLLEVLAACVLCFDWPWIAVGDWNMEPHELSQAGWLNTVNGKIIATLAATCAGGTETVLDYFVVSEAMAHLVQQVEVVDNSPTTPHWPVRLTLKATSWGHKVLARKRPKPFSTEVPVGPQRQEEGFGWTWAPEENPDDLELAWRSGCVQPKQRGAAFTTFIETLFLQIQKNGYGNGYVKTISTVYSYENKCAMNYSIITNKNWNDAYNKQLTKHNTNDNVDARNSDDRVVHMH